MKVLFVASECAPVAKVGGLADVVGSLPKALRKLDLDVFIALPFYGFMPRKSKNLKLLSKDLTVDFNGKREKFSLWQTLLPGSRVPVFLIDNDKYFGGKSVYLEEDASSGGSKAEAVRFLFLSVTAIKIAQLIKVQIIHCQDWHVSLIPFLAKKEKGIKTLLTIHNLGYQGIYQVKIINRFLGANFPGRKVNCLKLGILNANLVSTVSPNYAKEILTKEYGFGLEKYLRKRKSKIKGIINGLDIKYWNPSTDSYLKFPYSLQSLNKKAKNKAHLQKRFFKKANPKTPLLGVVSRLAEQKGFDLIEKIFPQLMKEDINLILLGKGGLRYQNFFRKMARKYPNKVGVKIDYNEELAHQIYAGADIFLMPSFFEPCGLGQLIAMRYGTIPLVRETGGLKDTVKPARIKKGKVTGTGFLFKKYQEKELLRAIKKSSSFFNKKEAWKKLQINGMEQDFSWDKSAKEYLKTYRKLVK